MINIRLVRPDGMDGIGWFSYESVRRIIQNHPEHEFTLLTDKPKVKDMFTAENTSVKLLLPPAKTLTLINWWHRSAAKYANKTKPDVYVSLDGQYSPALKIKVLTVIHDLNFLHHPEWMTTKLADFYNSSMPACANYASRIATVSEYSKKDISDSYGIDPTKIDVVYNGYNQKLLEVGNTPDKEDPFFLFVGIQVPRKNITGLIKSFTIFKENNPSNYRLKLAGHGYMWNSEMKSTLENSSAKSDIDLLGRTEFKKLKELYRRATALLYIPHFEGFGIPVLEGFAAGVPVICSNTTSLPEVYGEAALAFSPTDYEGVAEALQRVSEDYKLREELISKGKIQLEKFNWNNTAKALWESIDKTHNNGA